VVDDLKTRMRKLTLRLDRCLFCGNCQKNCIKETGIILSNQYDMVTPDKDEPVVSIDKELLVCDCCGSVMGAKDHLIFLAKKLGALAYGNPLLILAHQVELKLGEIGFDSKSSSKAPAGRAVIFRALCPYCRRLAMLEDEKTEQKGA
jgi:hypothetical protein